VAAAGILAVTIAERRPNDHHRIAIAVLETVHDLMY
jgi:hypothetical protein